MSNSTCNTNDEESDGCRDDSYALVLKMIAIAAILIASFCGVSIPLLGKNRRFLQTDSNLFVIVKAFAAGVILATGFVHILPDATSALTDSCLPSFPWLEFPFSGFIAMVAALATLLADSVGTWYYESKQIENFQPNSFEVESESEEERRLREHSHGHSHGIGSGDEEGGVRHIVVSQVLELGIVSHSVIIGLSLGVSQSPCTIKPLIGALSFHQFFEGFALGGCITQANFTTLKSTIMACFFAITTPVGIAIGIGVSSIYNANSPRALVIEGIFDSISAGILVYMALVDLIAADFLSKRMRCNVRLQVLSYFALFVGAVSMSSLAIWA
ncbi:hypothetical protein BUALT_Bualt05G0011900 [Buddleja alternifolia]|uniref:Uncharacterized protein n=1 Tax=Buddleja alternifolia TaxID=168488 RepID=A0AAV6XH72_9LAMI|nr:hypothetical protein BUALT_Bualt05G0011900 [Buddleja alternifolia]